MSILRFIFDNLDQYRRRFWLSVVAGFIANLASVTIPLFLAEFTKSGLNASQFRQLVAWLIIVVIILLASAWALRRYGEGLAFRFPNHLRLKYFNQLERLPMSQLAKSHTGYVLSLVNQIGERMNRILFDIFWTFTGIVANVGFLIYFTATKSWGLTFLNLVLFLTFVVVSTLLARKLGKLADAKNHQNALFGQSFVDFMSNLVTIKRLGIKSFAEDRLTHHGRASDQQIQRFQNAHANRWLLLHAIYYTASFATIGYLLYSISKGQAPVSILILFIAFYANIQGVIERVAENIITFAETRIYIRNLDEILAVNELAPSSTKMLNDWKTIELTGVKYRHLDNVALIQIPSLTINRGDAICLYGPSGEGKTTALNLIGNYLQCTDGQRTIDCVDYNDLEPTWFARESVYISQETELFNLSLRDNLLLGQDVKDDQLWQLLTDLQLADWANGLDKGLETVVGEKGLRLSAGQKQRINLARGILLNRSLYFLDEPTSHLDEATEAVVIKAMEKYLAGKTLIVVTHRPAIKKICSKFYNMINHVVTAE